MCVTLCKPTMTKDVPIDFSFLSLKILFFLTFRLVASSEGKESSLFPLMEMTKDVFTRQTGYYRKRGSASYTVREVRKMRQRETQRERERETEVTSH